MRLAIWTATAGMLAVTLFAQPASARCVRDVSESGAISVRCSDGVRGHLPSDDLPPPGANSGYRAHDWSRSSRSDNYAAPAPGGSSTYSYRSGDPTSRANDSAASALARGRGTGPNDRRPY